LFFQKLILPKFYNDLNIENIMKIFMIYQKLSSFVKNICKDRDSSHGFDHMKSVADNAMCIAKEENIYDLEILEMILTVAWLHDINDHKYHDEGNKNKLNKFIKKLFGNSKFDNKFKYKLIIDTIDRISFSKENHVLNDPLKVLDWDEVLGQKGILIRNIVSDADKLEALGKGGFKRCVDYVKHKNKSFNEKEIMVRVMKHSKEKLLRLKDEFIRTDCGKRMAIKLHDEFEKLLIERTHQY